MGVDTPPVLIMSPIGRVVAEADNDSSEDALYQALRQTLRAYPKWDQPSEEEVLIAREAEEGRIESLLLAAEQFLDLGEIERTRAAYERALAKMPSGPDRDRAAYGLGHALRLFGDFEEMDRAFARIEGRDSWAADLSIERAHASFSRGEFDALQRALAPFQARPPTARGAEALYLLGLALFHSGDAGGAKALWRRIIETFPEDPWVNRSDWAIFDLEQGARRTFSTTDERTPLGRIGYMGRKNPDLAPRGRRSGA